MHSLISTSRSKVEVRMEDLFDLSPSPEIIISVVRRARRTKVGVTMDDFADVELQTPEEEIENLREGTFDVHCSSPKNDLSL